MLYNVNKTLIFLASRLKYSSGVIVGREREGKGTLIYSVLTMCRHFIYFISFTSQNNLMR